MIEWIYRKSRQNFVTVMMITTRVIGSIGGGFVLFYVILSTEMPSEVKHRFLDLGYFLVVLAVALTVPVSWTHTKRLRHALGLIGEKKPVPPELAKAAALEAVRFPLRQNILEAIFVPLTSTLPMCLAMSSQFGVSRDFIIQIILASLLGIGLVLLITFFGSEQWMSVAIADLMKRGGQIDFDELPRSRLKSRIMLCFSIVILITGILIGALVHKESFDLTRVSSIDSAVKNLRANATIVTLGAIIVGGLYSHWLAQSITGRLNRLVSIMKSVQSGDLSVRAMPTGNDELDLLARRFNDMISVLDQQARQVRELNTTLEQKVDSRTHQLQMSLNKLQELDRLKTEFFSNVSHELRTPLMMILSPVRQVQSAAADVLDSRCLSLLDVAHNNGQRLLKQINQLLEFSKIEAGRAKVIEGPVDLNEVARRLAYAAQPLAEQRGVQLEIDLDPAMPVTSSDEDKLDIVLTNLVSNAIKFTSSGGNIWVKSQVIPNPERDGQLLLVSVADTGRGIAEHDIPRLFQRFVQLDGSTSREYSGTGLGLALVRELIELLGGKVGVTSKLGVGSTFQIQLPFKLPVEKTEVIESPSGMIRQESFAELKTHRIDLRGGRRPAVSPLAQTVLVVDDNPQIRDLLVDLLSNEYRVVTAEDGMHALAELEHQTPDLIISDVMMPYIDGQELCRRVKERSDTANVPFILLTARSKTSMKIEGLDCGAEDYVCKPFEDAELLARVRALLRVRRANVQLDQRNSELEKINKDLKQAQKQLVQAEKLSSLGQLVAGLAHEINNSINAVYNGVPAMKMRLKKLRNGLAKATGVEDQVPLPTDLEMSFEKLDMLANVIADGAERTARIVSDMKTFAHPGRDRDEDFDLHRALDLCLNLSTKQSDSKIHIERDYGDIPTIHGPYGQLHQVFLNLISNSVQAMKGGGTLAIRTELIDDFITIRLRDTGTGIPEKIRNRIFEPFFTTKAPGVGTGLGLSISYSIITQLGGTIECESEISHGTEFVLRIPLPGNLKTKDSHDAFPMGMV